MKFLVLFGSCGLGLGLFHLGDINCSPLKQYFSSLNFGDIDNSTVTKSSSQRNGFGDRARNILQGRNKKGKLQ